MPNSNAFPRVAYSSQLSTFGASSKIHITLHSSLPRGPHAQTLSRLYRSARRDAGDRFAVARGDREEPLPIGPRQSARRQAEPGRGLRVLFALPGGRGVLRDRAGAGFGFTGAGGAARRVVRVLRLHDLRVHEPGVDPRMAFF